jgi:hypothetical protein
VKVQGFKFLAQLRLIERIIDERVVTPNIHKRVLATKTPRQPYQRIQEDGIKRDAPLQA